MCIRKAWAYRQTREGTFALKDEEVYQDGHIEEHATSTLPSEGESQIQSNLSEPSPSNVLFQIPELLGRVFEHCLPERSEGLLSTIPLEAPVLLTRVCRLWRQTALSTPQLWASLRLICFSVVPCKVLAAKHIELLTTWLSRSGSCLLSLNLKYFGLSVSDMHMVRKILATVLPHAHRWRELDITAPMSSFQELLALIGSGTPSLETCRITITSSIACEPELALGPFRLAAVNMDLKAATQLKELSIKVDVDTDVDFYGLPSSLEQLSMNNTGVLLDKGIVCSNLRKVTLLHFNLSISHLRMLASSFPGLDDLYLDMSSFSNHDSSSGSYGPSFIVFPSLQTLVLRSVRHSGVDSLDAIGIILDRISCPTLRSLHLRLAFAPEMPWPHLARNLERTRPPLEELSMMGMHLPENELIDILQEAPSLRSLQACVRLTEVGAAALTLRQDACGTKDSSSTSEANPSSPTGICPLIDQSGHTDLHIMSSSCHHLFDRITEWPFPRFDCWATFTDSLS